MKTSPAGLAMIARFEGEVDHDYRDVAGVLTIGIGHVVRPGESFPNGITHAEALAILAQDVASAESAVNSYVAVALTQNQFDALVDFTFNVGAGALEKSDVLHLLNSGDYTGAAAALPNWAHDVQHGQRVVDPALLERRKAEAELFLTPDQFPPLPIFPP